MTRWWLVLALGIPAAALAEAEQAEPDFEQVALVEEDPLDDSVLPLSPEVLAHLRVVHARNASLRDNVFAKMGGSTVVSRAFLQCFSTKHVELNGQEALQATIDFFNERKIRGRTSFRRESLAAGVGWSLYYPLAGRPPRFAREVNAIMPRYALVLFGGNDSNAKTERVYARRLVSLIERLMARGVIPILGSSLPRRSKERRLWILRYNQITRAIAEQWNLPFIDYYRAFSELPREGLARDGVHPNVYGRGGLANACRFDEGGLKHGQNVRNLLTIKMLDHLRRAPIAGAVVEEAAVPAEPVPAEPVPAEPVPTRFEADTLPFSVALPSGPEFVVRVTIDEKKRVRASAFALKGPRPRLLWIREDGETFKRRYQTIFTRLEPGTWELRITRPEKAPPNSRLLVLITEGP